MSKIKFFTKFFTNRKEIGAIAPSSRFLAKKMIIADDLKNAEIILEFWAGTESFTKKIFQIFEENNICIKSKKIFIFEKDEDLYKWLIKKYPKYEKYIYNIDILELHWFLKDKKITKVDLVISGLPFKSLPLEVFYYVTKEFLPDFFHSKSLFIQFSYFKKFKQMLDDNFYDIETKSCFLNLPKAYIFKCKNFKTK